MRNSFRNRRIAARPNLFFFSPLMKTRSFPRLAAPVLAAGTLFILPASAALVVNFQSTQVSGTSASNIGFGTAFTTSTIASQAMNAGFEGQGTVFGGTGAADLSNDFAFRQSNIGFAPGRIYAQTNEPEAIRGLLMWDQTIFLNGGSTNPVSFGAASSLSLDVQGPLNSNGGGWGYRMVVRNGSDYFISNQAAGGDLSITNLPASTWAAFDPTANGGDIDALAVAIEGFDVSAYTTRTFDDVTAVGFFANSTRTQFSNALEVISFSVDAEVIPEPSALFLSGIGGLLMLRRRR